uniref:DUF5698 domain-containing protein n=1 Tax=Acrobeloides nanus TaxID=290746 RepID=A0A914BYT7_9BILA
MNFTNIEYVVFRSLLILEFIWIIINMNIAFMAVYLIVNVPQFHRNLIGMIGNMGLAFFVIAISRIIQIVGGSFDPNIG